MSSSLKDFSIPFCIAYRRIYVTLILQLSYVLVSSLVKFIRLEPDYILLYYIMSLL